MKIKKIVVVAVALVAVLLSVVIFKSDDSFTIASFNVRGPFDGGVNSLKQRMPRIVKVIRDNKFDIFGMQEAVTNHLVYLDEALPEYKRIGCGREKDRGGEGMYIYYRADRFECHENGTYWLSLTPDVPGSKYPSAGCPRTCTWGIFTDKKTNKKFRYLNTHLDHISSQARIDGVNVLIENSIAPAKAAGETILLTGDLNARLGDPDSPDAVKELTGDKLIESAKTNPIALLYTVLNDTYAVSKTPHVGTFGTFSGYKGMPTRRIDYIFVTDNVTVHSHATVNDRPDGNFPSDHDPVKAVVSW